MLTFRRKLVIATCQYDENIRLGQIESHHADVGHDECPGLFACGSLERVVTVFPNGSTFPAVDLDGLDAVEVENLQQHVVY